MAERFKTEVLTVDDKGKPIWEGAMDSLRVRVFADGSTEYEGSGDWYKTRESLLDRCAIPVVVAVADELGTEREKRLAMILQEKDHLRELDKLRAENEHWQRASGCASPETISAALARFYEQAECRPPVDGIERIKAERNALRERLARLEKLGAEMFDVLEGATISHPDGGTFTMMLAMGEFRELLLGKGGAK